MPSFESEGLVRLGREYAVEAMRWEDDEVVSSSLMLVWKRTLTPVCRCRWDSCRIPWRAIVKGVHASLDPVPRSPLPSIFAEGS